MTPVFLTRNLNDTGYGKEIGADKTHLRLTVVQNDSEKLYNHLTRQGFFQVGFNNNNFDYPVLHHFIRH